MSDRHISALAYIGIGATSLDDWQSFATDVLGMQVSRRPDADGIETLFLRMDDRAHRIAIRPGEDELTYAGWEVDSSEELDELLRDLDAAGVPYKEDPDLAAARGVHRLVRCQDPAGFQLEFCTGVTTTRDRFVSPTNARFVTSDPRGRSLGLGHIVLVCPNGDDLISFYIDVLKFAISDYIKLAEYGLTLTFTHVNPRHHSLAFGPAPEGAKPYLDHFMVEVDDIDTVGRALDVVREREMSLTASLGRHTNDKMVSFYVKSPSGIGVEYGTSGVLIDDDTWTVTSWDAAETWGHDRSH
ncbi:VOC family protein [Sphaerisporangium sp. NPDC051011]|uniref:VOC family protein n=1 Tax=Sphaerisporangium sp. NPDC051011 TaxID=3155792 RepID=UPI0033E0F07D